METILTPETAKAARQKTNLSQSKVAAELGINRAYPSLFESGKYLFEESVLSSLRCYYEENGYVFENVRNADVYAEPKCALVQVKEKFEIPNWMDETEAEELLATYTENRKKIISLCQKHPKEIVFWVDEDDLEDRKQEVLMLMAKNYAIIESFHGQVILNDEVTLKNTKKSIGNYVSDLLNKINS